MRSFFTVLSSVLALVAVAHAHGDVLSPPARRPGVAYKARCGSGLFTVAKAGWDGSFQAFLKSNDTQYNPTACDMTLCKGAQFADNLGNVQTFTPGQVVPFLVELTIPHIGPANVSIIDTATNTMIGAPLISFVNYSVPADNIPPNHTRFSVTIPDTIDPRCSVAGNCVLQWWWDGDGINQTYADCVDFTSFQSTVALTNAAISRFPGSFLAVVLAIPSLIFAML